MHENGKVMSVMTWRVVAPRRVLDTKLVLLQQHRCHRSMSRYLVQGCCNALCMRMTNHGYNAMAYRYN